MEQKGSPLGPPDNEAATAGAVRGMFARVASRYDLVNHLISAGLDLHWRRITAEAVRQTLERTGSVAADLCCGTGDLTFALARVSAGRVVGADFCQPMLQIARAKQKRDGHAPDKTRFIAADTLQLPFAEGELDLVSAAFGFRNLANYSEGLVEMHRVLRPGGMVAILEFSRMQHPIIGPLFRLYFRRLLPAIGTLVSGVSGPYQYLPDSVRHFPDQVSLAGKMRETGFTDVRYRNFLGGAVALHLGAKA